MNDERIRSLEEVAESLAEAYGNEDIGKLKVNIFRLRKLLIDIIPKILPNETYETISKLNSLSASVRGGIFLILYEMASKIETLIYADFNKNLLNWVRFIIKNLQDFLSALKKEQKVEPIAISEALPKITHESVKKLFIESGQLKGEWFEEVPVGLNDVRESAKLAIMKEESTLSWESIRNMYLSMVKHIDLVCVESDKLIYHGRIHDETLYLDYPIFDNKHVILIEAKTLAKEILQGVNQLLEYKNLFLKDWKNVEVKKIVIICPDWTSEAIQYCKEKGISAWEVTPEGVVSLTKDP
ncbi:MAG: hypothetical protein QW193_05535 [Nitrososphaerales archaeon]